MYHPFSSSALFNDVKLVRIGDLRDFVHMKICVCLWILYYFYTPAHRLTCPHSRSYNTFFLCILSDIYANMCVGAVILFYNIENCTISPVPGTSSIQFPKVSPDEVPQIPKNSFQFRNWVRFRALHLTTPPSNSQNSMKVDGTRWNSVRFTN